MVIAVMDNLPCTTQRFLLSAAVYAAAITCFANVQAASQGTLGSSSTGSLNFSVSKPARADITNLSDLRLSSWIAGDGAVTLTEDVCVYSTRPNGGYTIRATGSGSGSAYTLTNGFYDLPYHVIWNAGGVGALANSGEELSPSLVSSPKTNAATDSSSCSGAAPGPTARLIVRINETDISASPHGTYVGILTLMVTPN